MTDDTPRHIPVPNLAGPEPAPTAGPQASGKQLLSATWTLLRQDKELFMLPVAGSVFGCIASMILFIPGFGIGWLVDGREVGDLALWLGGFLAAIGATFVGVYFQAALVIGANHRAEGGDPTVGSCLRGAWTHKWQILAWAVVSATVGAVLRAARERLGSFGNNLSLLGGLGWSVATFVVVPVLVVEGVGPIDAIKRSTQVLRDTWGTSLRTAARGGIIAFALFTVPLLVFIGGVCVVTSDNPDAVIWVGVAIIVVAVIGLIVLATIFSSISAYARALIYRYAVGMPTPGIDDRVLAGAFRAK
ncbi:MAG: DUF6159 family protein [Aeromicrobium sp.]